MAESTSGSDSVQDRFREALERKRATTKARESHQDGHSKVNQTHGPAAGKRQFRRKSG